jgi:hypothetical protein
MVLGVCLIGLLVAAVVLLIAGVDKNSQATSLRQHGVRVNVKVTGCLGLLGGSGSNAAGYACTGTYVYHGHDFKQAIPGSSLLHSGQIVQGVIVPNDPNLLSTPQAVASQKASWKVFIVPAILLLAIMIIVAVLAMMRRRHQSDRRPAGD